ncbi:uncharacterized protein LOC111062175 [Nilaparvata lugens]|uniref:uncharacterized protein LOC111062175 n=1 Tax=Nilaparvata lugens TaxID=108931 RepID=UPI00193DD683|nr:uncharacterized protein LOC111062175 [Nilaparvata lugens]
MKSSEFSKNFLRDKIENSAPPRVHLHESNNLLDHFDGECKHCEKYNGINDFIPLKFQCEKLAVDPFPRKDKNHKNKPNLKEEELIMPLVDDANDFLADIGMLPSPTISAFNLKALQEFEFEYENCDLPPAYNSDSE